MSVTSSAIENLKEKLANLQSERKSFLNEKQISIDKTLSCKQSETNHSSIIEDLREIDREVGSLEHVITNSINLALTIINPVRERERIVTNIGKTVELLKIENELKLLLEKIKNEKSKNSIENKIHIIFEANNLIKINHAVFDNYKDLFLKESQDVLNYLQTSFQEESEKLQSKLTLAVEGNTTGLIKEFNIILTEMDKNSILTYKLTNEIRYMEVFFDVLSSYIIRLYMGTKLNDYIKNNNNPKEVIPSIEGVLLKILSKVSQVINEKKILYFKEFNDFKAVKLLIERMMAGVENTVESLVKLVLDLGESIEGSDINYICQLESNVIDKFEKFKFFIDIHLQKINVLEGNGKSYDSVVACTKKFNSSLYDLSERYGNNEIKCIKDKLYELFKDDSKTYNSRLEENLTSKYDELVPTTLVAVDDFFFILRTSGSRAVDSHNLQRCMAIINNLKGVISEELMQLLDLKISAMLIKTTMKYGSNKSAMAEIKYSCKEDPILSQKFTYGNLYLISCINAVDQCQNNLVNLFEELRYNIDETIIKSEVYDPQKIILPSNDESSDNLTNNIKWFKDNEIGLIEIVFNDVEDIKKMYDEFLIKKIKLAFEFLVLHIKSSVDILNSVNYYIEGRNITSSDLTESFSNKFVDETDKLLRQWKTQLSEGGFEKFLSRYAKYVSYYIEELLLMKRYSTYGVIVLEKVSIVF